MCVRFKRLPYGGKHRYGCDRSFRSGRGGERLKLVIKDDPIPAQDILKGLLLHLSELQKDYPENIKIKISEVQ